MDMFILPRRHILPADPAVFGVDAAFADRVRAHAAQVLGSRPRGHVARSDAFSFMRLDRHDGEAILGGPSEDLFYMISYVPLAYASTPPQGWARPGIYGAGAMDVPERLVDTMLDPGSPVWHLQIAPNMIKAIGSDQLGLTAFTCTAGWSPIGREARDILAEAGRNLEPGDMAVLLGDGIWADTLSASQQIAWHALREADPGLADRLGAAWTTIALTRITGGLLLHEQPCRVAAARALNRIGNPIAFLPDEPVDAGSGGSAPS